MTLRLTKVAFKPSAHINSYPLVLFHSKLFVKVLNGDLFLLGKKREDKSRLERSRERKIWGMGGRMCVY